MDLPHYNVSTLDFGKGTGLVIKGRSALKSLKVHPDTNAMAFVTYNLAGQYRNFAAGVAINDGANAGRGSATPLTFIVEGDGRQLWTSRPAQKCGDFQECAVSVAGVNRLTLKVYCPGDSYCAHAVWVDPRLAP
jgi:hypothetical protein